MNTNLNQPAPGNQPAPKDQPEMTKERLIEIITGQLKSIKFEYGGDIPYPKGSSPMWLANDIWPVLCYLIAYAKETEKGYKLFSINRKWAIRTGDNNQDFNPEFYYGAINTDDSPEVIAAKLLRVVRVMLYVL